MDSEEIRKVWVEEWKSWTQDQLWAMDQQLYDWMEGQLILHPEWPTHEDSFELWELVSSCDHCMVGQNYDYIDEFLFGENGPATDLKSGTENQLTPDPQSLESQIIERLEELIEWKELSLVRAKLDLDEENVRWVGYAGDAEYVRNLQLDLEEVQSALNEFKTLMGRN